jgi:multiple sugar transport system substrate-binding protein
MKRLRDIDQWEKELRHFPVHLQGIPSSLKRKVEERIVMESNPKHRKLIPLVAFLTSIAALILIVIWQQPLLNLLKPDRTVTEEKFDSITERQLKVQVMHRDTFMRQYGEAFVIKYPNITIESVETMGLNTRNGDLRTAYYDLLDKEQPEVLFLPISIYRQMATDGLLYPLDTMIQKERYDLEAFQRGLIQFLRDADGGKLYGLAPTYNAQAIYFNKDLFNRYGVPYPTDKMSWEQLLQLAARFPTDGKGDNRVYGFAPPVEGAYTMVDMIARTERLGVTDSEGKKLLLDSPSYRKIWESVANGIQKGWLQQPARATGTISGIDFYKRNAFMTGQAAMILQFSGFANDLTEGRKRYNLSTFEWDVVTEPISSEKPDESTSTFIDGVYAINAKAANPKDAWELIKLINSEPIAKKNAGSMFHILSTLQNVPMKPETVRMEAFTILQISPDSKQAAPVLPQSFSPELVAIMNQEILSFTQGAQSLEQTVEAIQSKGQTALDKANLQAKQP